MKILVNEKLIQRNKKIGNYTLFASLAVLAGGLVLSMTQPVENSSSTIILSYVLLLVGFILSQISFYFQNRFGGTPRSPRHDQAISDALKGLDDRFTLYHYSSPAAHLLIGPAGAWILRPLHQRGKFIYSNGRYRQQGVNLFVRTMFQEGIGKPEMEAKQEEVAVEKALQASFPEGQVPDVKSVLVFLNPTAETELDDAPVPGITLKKLKDFIRKNTKTNSLSADDITRIRAAFGEGIKLGKTANEKSPVK